MYSCWVASSTWICNKRESRDQLHHHRIRRNDVEVIDNRPIAVLVRDEIQNLRRAAPRQRVSRRPHHHRQVLAAVFGTTRMDALRGRPRLNDDSSLSALATPWAGLDERLAAKVQLQA